MPVLQITCETYLLKTDLIGTNGESSWGFKSRYAKMAGIQMLAATECTAQGFQNTN